MVLLDLVAWMTMEEIDGKGLDSGQVLPGGDWYYPPSTQLATISQVSPEKLIEIDPWVQKFSIVAAQADTQKQCNPISSKFCYFPPF